MDNIILDDNTRYSDISTQKLKEGTHVPEKISVGLLAAMAIGNNLTQETLNTFHTAGIANELVSKGVSRIQEIFNNSLSLPRTIFTVNTMENMDKLAFTSLGSMCTEDPREVSLQECLWLSEWESNFGNVDVPPGPHVVIAVRIDYRKQLEKKFDLSILQTMTFDSEELPTNPIPLAVSPVLYHDGKCFNEFLLAFTYELDWLIDFGNLVLYDGVDVRQTLLYFVEMLWIPRVLNLPVFGIENVEMVFFDKQYSKSIIVGNMRANLLDVLHISPTTIVCNKASEMVQIFGIEVGKRCLVEELCSIMPGLLVCHIKVLVDYMTWSGKITSISRYSIRQDPDTLKRMSFEEAVRNIICACIGGEVDKLASVSSKIVASKLTIF